VTNKSLDECKDQLFRLADGPTADNQLAARGGEIAADYWIMLNGEERASLRKWLKSVRDELGRITARQGMKRILRRAEVAKGALAAIERKAPRKRG
jgi:hypothetical protein